MIPTYSTVKKISSTSFRIFASLVLAFVASGTLFLSSVAAQTAKEYCDKKFTPPSFQNTACVDGWENGESVCDGYESFAGADVVRTCKEASQYHLAHPESDNTDTGKCVTTTTQTGPKSSTETKTTAEPNADGTCPSGTEKEKDDSKDSDKDSSSDKSSGSGSSDTSKDSLLETLKSLKSSSEKDDEQADNNYGQYVNGAGDLQPIAVNRAEGDNRPAIIFFNGGGWHGDDGVGQKIAPWANERGYTTFVATYRLGSSGVYYMLDDVLRAIKHVRNNAGMYGIDASRVAIWGDSAGGSLVMRAAGTGKSGAKVAVGWSAPTNAYTALFKSVETFAVGMDHSTCAPTDINGVEDVVDVLSGGNGKSKDDYQGGVKDNNFGGEDAALDTVISVLELAEKAQTTSSSTESASKSLETGNAKQGGSTSDDSTSDKTDKDSSSSSSSSSSSGSDLAKNAVRLAAKKFIECIDNFNSASPALFASPLSPPAFLAGYDTDPVVDPGQAYQMRDKLRSLGIPSEALILPGVPGPKKDGENHLDYNEKFVPASLDFVDKFLNPKAEAPEAAASGADQGANGGGQTASASSTGSTSSSTQGASASTGPRCEDTGGTWQPDNPDGPCVYPKSGSSSPTTTSKDGKTQCFNGTCASVEAGVSNPNATAIYNCNKKGGTWEDSGCYTYVTIRTDGEGKCRSAGGTPLDTTPSETPCKVKRKVT